MKKYMKQLIVVVFSGIMFLHGISQPTSYPDCEPLGEDNKYLWFNDTYQQTLIDNALRCFRLNSIGSNNDSCFRIWVLEDDYPDSPYVYRMKLFELGVKGYRNYATYYILEWEGGYTSPIVKCIKKKAVKPLNGWIALEKTMRKSKVDKIYTIPTGDQIREMSTHGSILVLQYISDGKTITLDFSWKENLVDNIRFEREKRFIQLIKLINNEFCVNLSEDKKGHNFLKVRPSTSDKVLTVDQEVTLDPVDTNMIIEKPKGFPKDYVGPYLSKMYEVDNLSPFVSYMIDTILYSVSDGVERDKRLDTMSLENFYSIEYEASDTHPEGTIVLRTIGSQTQAEIEMLLTKAKSMFVDIYSKGRRELPITEDPALITLNGLVPAWKAKSAIKTINPEDILAIKIWQIPVNWGSLKKNRKNGLVQIWFKPEK